MRGEESGKRKAENGKWKAESGERRAESGKRRAESGERRAESGERKTESGKWRAIHGYTGFRRKHFSVTSQFTGWDMVNKPPYSAAVGSDLTEAHRQ
jgi:hypothetical protein